MSEKGFSLKQDRLSEGRVFRDPIHNYIHVDYGIFWKLINTREMQRLRRIHQLGGACQVYHGAEHSRFNHSLGVYEVVRQMCENTALKDQLSEYDEVCVLCAALLHDVGHGPFSHAFEHIFPVHHEVYTTKIILGHSEVHDVLKSYDDKLPHDVASIVDKSHPYHLLIQMITSQLDGDRMDFLLRDSYFTGTTYGKFDMNRILRTMRVFDRQLVFKESGTQAIENYILARYHMYWQVYYHPVSRSYEQLLGAVFLRIKDLYQQGYLFQKDISLLIPFLENTVTVEDYLRLDESVLQYYLTIFQDEEDTILKDLSYRFLNRHLFKYSDLKTPEQLNQLRQLAQEKGYPPRYYILTDDQKQVPYQYGMSGDVDEILILKDEHLFPLSEVSEVVYAIVHSSRSKSDAKVYYPQEIFTEF